MKKALFSVLLAFTFSFTLAQDVAKDSKSTPIKLDQTSRYKINSNKLIVINGKAVMLKQDIKTKDEKQPMGQQKATEGKNPTLTTGNTDNKK